jgi:hypothetical protein
MMMATTKPVPAGTSIMEEFRVSGEAQFLLAASNLPILTHLPSED